MLVAGARLGEPPRMAVHRRHGAVHGVREQSHINLVRVLLRARGVTGPGCTFVGPDTPDPGPIDRPNV